MTDGFNSILTLPTTSMASFVVALIRNGAEYRLWSTADRRLCGVYRDPAGHLIAFTENWKGPGTVVYHGCEMGEAEYGPRRRKVGAYHGALCTCEDPSCASRHEPGLRLCEECGHQLTTMDIESYSIEVDGIAGIDHNDRYIPRKIHMPRICADCAERECPIR